jgi:hypothetical protein
MLRRQHSQRPIGLPVELDEDVVPDLEHVGIVGVDQAGGVAAADAKSTGKSGEMEEGRTEQGWRVRAGMADESSGLREEA